jgi:osmotically-inducible protein OsmY
MDDRTLQLDVVGELNFIPDIDPADIGVAVESGVVTLSGRVPSYGQKLAIEKAVSRIRGVRAIAQQIIVRYPEAKKTADDEIAKRILAIFAWDTNVPEDRIKVNVSHGWVTLTGEVDHFYQRQAAESDVRKLGGVTGIANQIVLGSAFRPNDIKQRIERALMRNAEIEARNIRVTIDKDTATLSGTVRSRRDRDVAEAAAWAVPGIRAVNDQLTYVG